MSKKLAIGLIGVGGFGASHLRVLQQLEAEGLVRLTCVADPFGERLAATRSALETRGVRWYEDYRELLERESELLAVAIAAPIHLHMRIASAAIARGLFVYLEKPPVPLIQQLDELITLDVHRHVAVGFQLIHLPTLQQLKRWRVAGALGKIQSIRVCGCSPRRSSYYDRAPWAGRMMFDGEAVFDGPATNALSHWLHNIMYLAAERTDEFDSPVEIEAELYRARPMESYDVLCMCGRFDSGIRFHYAVTHATEKALPCRLELIGSEGSAEIFENAPTVMNSLGLPYAPEPHADPLLESWRSFVRFAGGETVRAPTTLADARGYVLSTNAGLISSAGIHDVDRRFSRTFGSGETSGYDVSGLCDLMENSVRLGRLFSEMGEPWARRSTPVLTSHLRVLKLDY